MSTFLTPPVWYDKNGNLNEMLTGDAETAYDVAIGFGAKSSDGGVAIEGTSSGGGVTIGGSASGGGVAIGNGAEALGPGCIAIGEGASTSTRNTIQLGVSNVAYTLQVGSGAGTSKIGALSFNSVTPTSIASSGLYWCTAEQTLSAAGTQQIICHNAFLWIGSVNSATASATDGAATFTYDKPEGQSGWAIRVSGNNVSNLKCYKVFA